MRTMLFELRCTDDHMICGTHWAPDGDVRAVIQIFTAWVSIATVIDDSRITRHHSATLFALTTTVGTVRVQSSMAISRTMTVGIC